MRGDDEARRRRRGDDRRRSAFHPTFVAFASPARRLSVAFVLALALAPALASAYPDPGAVPRYADSPCFQQYSKRFVHDYLQIVAPEMAREIEGAACEVYSESSAHFVLVTVPDTEGEPLESYALHLFETWGIGDKERNDGLLVLLVDDYLGSGEGALRIEVGYGLEGVVNARVSDDVFDAMVDARDRALAAGETQDEARAYALATGSNILLHALDDGYVDGAFPDPEPQGPSPAFIFTVVVIVIILVVLLSMSSQPRRRTGWGYTSHPGAWSGSRWGGGSMGGGGFGGGGSFGGGRSGGGGRGGRF